MRKPRASASTVRALKRALNRARFRVQYNERPQGGFRMQFKPRGFAFAHGATPLILFTILAGIAAAQAPVTAEKTEAAAADEAGFKKNVFPILANTCSPCHNERMASGGLNVANFE